MSKTGIVLIGSILFAIVGIRRRGVASCLALMLENFFQGIEEFAVFGRRVIKILNVICLHGRQLCNRTSWHFLST